MDISIRDWMIIIGVLLIVAVLLDGYRRMRNKPGRVRMALSEVPDVAEPEQHLGSELPNGGARVIGRSADEELSGEGKPLQAEIDDASDPLFSMTSRQVGETPDLLDGLAADDVSAAPQGGANIDSEVLMLHVIARDESGFAGEDILQVLLALELRFGEMNFFHRHEQSAGKGPIQFSVANMLQPGVFDIDAMAGFSTPGLIFFLTLPGPRDMMAAFDMMAETAQSVADNLAGDLLDDTRSATTKQTLEHMRQRIRDLERRMLTQSTRPG